MNSNHKEELELEISRVLKDLPELEAPASLVHQVMSRLERRSALIWYRRSWQTWPVWLRTVSLVILAALFVGLCFAGWEFTHTQVALTMGQRAGEWFSGLGAAANTLMVLLNSICLVLGKLGTGFIVACLCAIGLAYVMCVGLGTMYLRLAFVKQ
jgi:hypothetical protein